jgi:non-ribosomal peptide synthetase component F
MLSLAAFEALLFRWSGERDQVIALDFAGRGDELEEDQIGLFTSPVALRADLSGDPSLFDLADKSRVLLGDALSHRVPYERLVGALGTGRRRFAGFRIFFSHLARGGPPSLGGTPLCEVPPDISIERTDLRLMLEERPGGLSVNLAGATALFDHGDLARLANTFQCCLTQLCRRPEVRLSQLEWISASDRTQLACWEKTRTMRAIGSPSRDDTLRKKVDSFKENSQPIGDIPAHAQLDDVGVEWPPTVDRATGDRLRRSALLQGPGILPDAPGCTRTIESRGSSQR